MEKWRKERNKERKKKEQESAEAISGLKRLITCINFFTYLGIFSIHRVTTGSWDQAFTKIITDANPGSDYDQVYRNNFEKDFSINSENSFKSMMDKLMNT